MGPGRIGNRMVRLSSLMAVAVWSSGAAADDYSLRFLGHGVSAPDRDRVKISLDGPHRPVDIGVGDFTVEWWMKARLADNGSSACFVGPDNWIYGNIILDRDVFGAGDWGDWGVSVAGGFIAFGVAEGSNGVGTCGSSQVADERWHHVAVTRRASDGRLRIYVDGAVEGESLSGPTGDISYRDGRVPGYPNDPFLVLGAEKHDAGAAYPSYNGWLDELRLSTVLRYGGNFTVPTRPFVTDAATAALYHFNEGSGTEVRDSSGAAGGPSHGSVRYGGNPAGPIWATDTPFSANQIFGSDFEGGDLSEWSRSTP